MAEHQVLVASNRGPVSFERDAHGNIVAKRGGGGLVTALTGAMQLAGGLWIASAMSDEDRERARDGHFDVDVEGTGYRLRYLSFPPATYDRYYNGISNRILWFLNHYLWDVPRTPRFDDGTQRDWAAYRRVNQSFAAALHDEAGQLRSEPLFLVQDYHLSLVPAMLRKLRPGALINHFSHIPNAGPTYTRILPTAIREELLAGLLGADVLGLQAEVWAENFLTACRILPGTRVDFRRRSVQWQGRTVRVRVYPVATDTESLEAAASTEEVASISRRLARWRGDAKLILRVDRTELSKNILRGFLAFETFLRRHPRWRRRVRFLALLNSSRGSIAEYRQYMRECMHAAGRINAELGDDDWSPIRVVVGDHFPTVVAAYRLYDVLMVNPVYDGMNLIAKEGPVVNRRKGVLILSENAGAFSELGRHSICINPFDVLQTAEALAQALEMEEADRGRRIRGLRAAIRRGTAERWVRRQLDDLEAVRLLREGRGST
ncbi:MAG: trehalose-6-phosphate synthase [Actinobacteria bacterium]|nr:trehalose-6-phosphate synthase [Actinomycetota bacterium]